MPRTGWPAWAVLPAAVVIFLGSVAVAAGALFVAGYRVGGAQPPEFGANEMAIVMLVAQLATAALTLLFAGFFSSNRAETLALRRPRQGWGVLVSALIPLFAVSGVWTTLLLLWRPDVVTGDLAPFKEMLHGSTIPTLLLLGVGAPLSEEFLFRGFLFSGLAKSRLGLLGTAILTTLLWSALHAGYSVFGLIEVSATGLYLSWLLVRTGSLWVTIFCHAVYNTAVGLVLFFVTLPPLPA